MSNGRPRRTIALALITSAILAARLETACHAHDAPLAIRSAPVNASNPLSVASVVGCGTRPIGKVIVATLNRAPFVTVSANGHPVTLLLDTGTERTVLTPEVAVRIGARRPSIEFRRNLRGIAGTLPIHEVELRSFSAGHVVIPWRRIGVAPVTIT